MEEYKNQKPFKLGSGFSFLSMVYWLNQNSNLFNGTKLDISVNTAYEQAVEYIYLTGKGNLQERKAVCKEVWKAPSAGVKLNVDESFDNRSKKGGVGDVFRNTEGD